MSGERSKLTRYNRFRFRGRPRMAAPVGVVGDLRSDGSDQPGSISLVLLLRALIMRSPRDAAQARREARQIGGPCVFRTVASVSPYAARVSSR